MVFRSPLKNFVGVLFVIQPRFKQSTGLLNSLKIGRPFCQSTQRLASTLYGNKTTAFPGKPDKTLTMCVEGNIASGKSTFLQHMKKFRDVEVFDEQVKIYQNIGGQNLLAKVYEEPSRWSFTLQTYIQLVMLQHHTVKSKAPVKLIERSIYSAKYLFVDNFYKSGKMTDMEYVILTDWYNWIVTNHNCHVDLIVYLRTSPEVAYERIRKRCRREEATISLDYLIHLHDHHEDWLVKRTNFMTNFQVMILDANQKPEDIAKVYREKTEEILFCS